MYPIEKLKRLPLRLRTRKAALLLQQAELDIEGGTLPDIRHLASLLTVMSTDHRIDKHTSARALQLSEDFRRGRVELSTLRKHLNELRHQILRSIGAEPAEWDFRCPGIPNSVHSHRTVFPARVYVEDVRSPYNVGAIFRTAEALGVEHIYLTPDTPLPTHPRAAKTARDTVDIIPWTIADLPGIQAMDGIFALELGGEPIGEFTFPDAGLVLVGSEELGLSPEALELADSRAGRVSIPLVGVKRSLNVSVAFGILMFAWHEHLSRRT